MGRFLEAFALLLTRRRVASLVILAVAFGALAYHIRYLKADFTPSDLFSSFDGQDDILADFQDHFGTSENIILVLIEGENVLDQAALQYLHELSQTLRALDHFERAESITITPIPRHADEAAPSDGAGLLQNLGLGDLGIGPSLIVEPVIQGDTVEAEEADALEAAIASSPLIDGRLVSHDRSVAVVALFLRSDITRMQDFRAAVNDIRDVLGVRSGLSTFTQRTRARFEGERLAHMAPPGVDTYMAGLPYLRTVVVERFRTDQTVIVPLALLACMVILAFTVRWIPGVVLPLVAVSVSALMVMGGMGWVGEPINIVNNIVPALIIIIGISNAIHIISRYREELRHGMDRLKGTQITIRSMTVACFLTSFTTAVGFGSLAISRTPLLKRFGITAAIGVMISYVVTIVLIPILLTVFKKPKRDGPGTRDGILEILSANGARWVMNHAKLVLLAMCVLFGLAIYAAYTGSVVDNSVLDQFDEADELVATTRLIEDKLVGVMPFEVALSSDTPGRFEDVDVINAVDELSSRLGELGPVLSTTTYATYLHEAWALVSDTPENRTRAFENDAQVNGFLTMLRGSPRSPLASYLTVDGQHARISLRIADVGAQATIALGDEVNRHAAEVLGELGDIETVLTGDAYVNAMGLDAVIDDLVGSLLLAIVIIFGFLTILFRDIRLGLLSIAPNVLPLVLTMAFMAVRGIRLNTATAMIFAISIGLAVDATIHLITRFREEERVAPVVEDALIRAARGTGRAIVLTCVMLAAGFSVMTISSFVPIRLFGQLIAVTALGTLLGNMVLLPALLKLFWAKHHRTVEA